MATGTRIRTVNCLVKDKESELHFTLTSDLAKCDINFSIVPEKASEPDGSEVGVLEIKNNEPEKQLMRRNESKPFPKGSIVKKNATLKEVEKSYFYAVKLEKKKKDINLNNYFLIENKK